jgi:3-phosphoglycerate kinase
MNLPYLSKTDLNSKKVLLRADLDVSLEKSDSDILRLEALIPTLKFLSERKCKTIIIGHMGRPEGKNEKDSLKDICQKLSSLLGKEIKFIPEIISDSIKREIDILQEGEFLMLDNLRFDKREEENDQSFAKSLSEYGEVFVNEAFATSHRSHASIVGIPKFIKGFLGLRFEKEVENLSKVLDNPERPVVAVISGVKEDKTEYAKALINIVDKVLAGGRLPEYLKNERSVRDFKDTDKLIIANLIYDKEDITLHSVERFKEEIKKAKTIVLAGVLGKYEDEGHRQATKEIFEAIANSDAFKIIGGGDSLVAIGMFNLTQKFNWVSVGGGAMLEYLVKGSLPGIDALLH